MPYEYVPAYLAFLGVGRLRGRGADAGTWWIAALSGWFLIHGHACFLLFVPAACWLGAVRGPPDYGYRTCEGERGGVKTPVAAAGAACMAALCCGHQRSCSRLPIAGELGAALAGELGKYFAYSGSRAGSGGHPVAPVAPLRAVVLVAARGGLGGRGDL